MRFRPCIDIHNGKVKQIVGSSLKDKKDEAVDNFISSANADYYAGLYRDNNLPGGHIILLNPVSSPYYKEDAMQAQLALSAYPGGMMIGGGMNPENSLHFLRAGASQVIVTSYVFKDGKIDYSCLNKMIQTVGRDQLVLDLSCRRRGDKYMIVTDRWQKFTETSLDIDALEKLSHYCSEFLIHAVDVEGKVSGIEEDLARLLGKWDGIPVTYAGGISSLDDIKKLGVLSSCRLDYTIGSALDLFGGTIPFQKLVHMSAKQNS